MTQEGEVPERRYYESTPGYSRMDQLHRDLAIAMNPQLFFHLADPNDPDRIMYLEEDRLAVIDEINRQITEAMTEGVGHNPFQQFENGLIVEDLSEHTVPRENDYGTIYPDSY